MNQHPFCFIPRSGLNAPAWINLNQICSVADLSEEGSPPVVVCYMADKQKILLSGEQAVTLMKNLCHATSVFTHPKSNIN